ncbi:MAG: hypothetical protein DLM63_04170 [Solirubrobacterales bacterium]|nr:MAG: hypothetical protein DLM63_04170 [Solirubrobacterales bacterium]
MKAHSGVEEISSEAAIGATDGTAVAAAVNGLVKRYGPVEAVSGIDFEVFSGETFGFLGPNGAGKSTQMQSFMALMQMLIMPMFFLFRRALPRGGAAPLAGDSQPRRSAHLCRRSDAPGGLRAPQHQRDRASHARSGRHVVRLARAGADRSGGRSSDRDDHAGDRDRRVQPYGVAGGVGRI